MPTAAASSNGEGGDNNGDNELRYGEEEVEFPGAKPSPRQIWFSAKTQHQYCPVREYMRREADATVWKAVAFDLISERGALFG